MANYAYKCPSCSANYTLVASITDDLPEYRPCPRCGHDKSTRSYQFNHAPSFREHWNHSLGAYVNNNKEFEDGLKRQSAELSERIGMNVDLQPLGPSEMAEASAHGVTEEGLYETFKTRHDSQVV